MKTFIWPALPIDTTGLATSANQVLEIAQLTAINANTDGIEAALAPLATEATVATLLTDTQLRASPVPVSGPLTDTELRATAVPVSGPLTDTELRATAVPVSGPLTDAELRASAVPVSAASLPLPSGAATEAKQDAQIAADALFAGKTAAALVPEAFDYMDLTYVGAGNGQGEIATVVYKDGGSGGTTVATITLAYNVDNKISSVTRS